MRVAKTAKTPPKVRTRSVPAEVDAKKPDALRLLIEGSTPREVCTVLNLNYTSLWRWRTHDKAFSEALADARRERMSLHRADIESAVTRALEFVVQTIDDDSAPQAVRLRAAEGILDRAGFEPGSASRGAGDAVPIDAEGEVDLLKSIMADPRLMAMLDRMRGGGAV